MSEIKTKDLTKESPIVDTYGVVVTKNAGVTATVQILFSTIKTWIKSSIVKADVGLGNVDNTSDANKPVSSAQSVAIGLKEDTSNKSTSTADVASSVKFPVWTAIVSYVTGLGYLLASTASATYQAILTETNFGAFINSLTSKVTPVNADSISIVDSADGNKQKKVSLTNFKAFLKTYFDTIYSTGGSSSIGYQPIYSGKWRSFLFSGSATSLTSWNNLVIYVPYAINENHSVTDMGVYVATGSAGSNIRLAIYSDSNGAPLTMLEESGDIPSTSIGFKSFTFATPKSLTTTNKLVWMAIQVSAAPVALSYTTNLISPYLDFSTGQISSRATQSQAYGSFPATATPSFGSPNAPILCLKAQ